jgi:hypothetical protein
MIWLLFAAQLAAPIPLNPTSVVSPDDMPADVVRAGINRFTAFRITVRPDGSLQDCLIERASGDPKLDTLVCSLMLKRAKFQPASWSDGTPSFGVFRSKMTWTIGGGPTKAEIERAYPADMELSIDHLPAGADRRTSVGVQIAVDEHGRVVACDQKPRTAADHTKVFPELVSVACQQMTSRFIALPAKDASGQPVRSVQSATVLFGTASLAPSSQSSRG